MTTIRGAVLADAQQIRLLEKQLIDHERGVIDIIKEGDEVKYQDIMALIQDKENTLLLVMEKEGEIIACGFGQVRRNADYYKHAHFGYIGMMSVSMEHRGQGYAGDIIKELFAWFKTKNITEVKLKVFTNNPGAIKAYGKLGFEEYSKDMRLEI